ncbi:MAG: gamma-glutamyl-gamma-aminobutyrate hydrolase family protein [Archangiaceae bacterium]|nr:gamma-glutamyl-gamma-aminobutyrate hydrolase family protein [Archangiaceae bacterium]
MLKVAARSVVSKTSVPVKAAAQVVRTAAARLEGQLAPQTSKGLERALAVVNALRVPPQGSRQHYVRIEGALADVMLPASGGCEVDSFRRWAKALAHVDAFGDQRKQVHALTQVNVVRGEGACDDRPRIGIMVHEAMDLLDPEKRDLKSLVAAVERLGARPVFIPPLADLALGDDPLMREQVAGGIVKQLDGLIGPGGWDIHPRIYRARFDGSSKEGMVYVRDRFEAELVQTARESNVFTLGICRTMQLTNAIGEGGVMGQDLLSHGKVGRSHVMMNYGSTRPRSCAGPKKRVAVSTWCTPAASWPEIFGNSEVPTNSIHHQWVQKAASDPRGGRLGATKRPAKTSSRPPAAGT